MPLSIAGGVLARVVKHSYGPIIDWLVTRWGAAASPSRWGGKRRIAAPREGLPRWIGVALAEARQGVRSHFGCATR